MNQDTYTRTRLIVLGVSLLAGMLIVTLLSLVLGSPDSELGAFLLDRHTTTFPYPVTIQNFMWLLFSVGCGELWTRYNQSKLESVQTTKHLLPEDDTVMLRVQDLGPLYRKTQQSEGGRDFFVQRLIGRCILQFQGSKSVSQTNSILNSSLELIQHELDLKYTMIRYLVWLIPTIGFIGTIVGIAISLDYAASIENPQDPRLLASIAGRLGVAFYTTLLALVQSAILVFVLHIVQGREEMALNRAGQYCLDNLINRLYEK